MKRSGFTMIELIFVIVILGILAAVAIPKLAATRDDAQVSKVLSELGTLKNDMSAFYTAQGTYATGAGNIQNMTNVLLYDDATCGTQSTQVTSPDTLYYCVQTSNGLEDLVSIQTNDTDGNLTVTEQTVTGNIGTSVSSTDVFGQLTGTVLNGGQRVRF